MDKWKDETLDLEYRTAWFMYEFDFWSIEYPLTLETEEEVIAYVADLHRTDIKFAADEFTAYLTEIADTLEEKDRAAALQMIALINPAA